MSSCHQPGKGVEERQYVPSAQGGRQREEPQGSKASQAGGLTGFMEEGHSDLDNRGERTGEGIPHEGIV